MDSLELFLRVQDHVGKHETRNGWTDIDCPFCGATSTRQDPHFGFSRKGYNCFVCGAHGNLHHLAQHLRVPGFDGTDLPPIRHRAPRPQQAPEPEPTWLREAAAWLETYEAAPDKCRLWQRYKPLDDSAIERHRFGVGYLPDMGWAGLRLTVPLFEEGEIVGFAGRAIPDSRLAPKWLVARGSRRVLWNLDRVRGGEHVLWIVENYVDAALLNQAVPNWDAVATGMARPLRAHEVRALKGKGVRHIIVQYDNDLAGQASGEMKRRLVQQWREEKGFDPPAEGAGDRSARLLERAGFNVCKFVWPQEAPKGADPAWLIEQDMMAVAA